MTFAPSTYQTAIADFVRFGKGNGIVGAVAGSGKTTTLVKIIAPLLSGSSCFLAFNKSIAEELGCKLRQQGCETEARTIHSLGLTAVRSRQKCVKVDSKKYKWLVKDFMADLPASNSTVEVLLESGAPFDKPLLRMIDLVRVDLVDPKDRDGVESLALHHNIELPEHNGLREYWHFALAAILKKGRSQKQTIDFCDMLWLPATTPNMVPFRFDFLLVDECQDLSKAQLAVVKKALRPGGRAIFVGDKQQAINGFAGADCNSFDNILNDMNATLLPLSICYRCPTSHLELVKGIVPQIEARPGAPEGTVDSLEYEKALDAIGTGDMMLCRTNAPLVKACLKLIGEGKPARVKGRDIGAGLIVAAKKISKSKHHKGWDTFGQSILSWETAQLQKLLDKGIESDEPIFQSIQDRADCLRVIWESNDIKSLRAFEKVVNNIFDDNTPGIQLSSVHRAKGLEAERVFILKPELMPFPAAKPGTWQYQQELHISYVAKTRSLDYLCFVSE